MLGCTIFAQKKDAHQRKIPLICAHTYFISNLKTLYLVFYLAGHFAAATAALILSSILALLTLAPARLKIVMLG